MNVSSELNCLICFVRRGIINLIEMRCMTYGFKENKCVYQPYTSS